MALAPAENTALLNEAAARLRQAGYSPEVWKLNRLLPLEAEGVLQSAARTGRLLAAEECAEMGCMGGRIAAQLSERGIAMKKVRLCNTGRGYVPQGTVAQLRQWCGLDEDSLYQAALEVLQSGA